ncbi:hypothetical protein Tco_0181449, partial [Tanacetum coccineum]
GGAAWGEDVVVSGVESGMEMGGDVRQRRGWLLCGGVWVVVAWWRRVEESGCGDRIDPVMRSVFGVGRKSPPEKFSGGGWPERGDGGRW